MEINCFENKRNIRAMFMDTEGHELGNISSAGFKNVIS